MLHYKGRAFREEKGLSVSALAREMGVRRATLIALEQNRPDCVNRRLVGRVAAYWQSQGIQCKLEDLLEIVELES